MKPRTRRTRADAKALFAILGRVRRDWKPGDAVLGRGDVPTTVEYVSGEIVYFANGESAHWARVRAVR